MRNPTLLLPLFLMLIELVLATLPKFELPNINLDFLGLGSHRQGQYDDSYDRYGDGYGNYYHNGYGSNYYKEPQKTIDLGLPLGAIGGLGLGLGVGAVKGLLLGTLLANTKKNVKHIYPNYGYKQPDHYGGYGGYSHDYSTYSDDYGSNNGLGFDFGLHKNLYHIY